jgi:O-Antigen ligase
MVRWTLLPLAAVATACVTVFLTGLPSVETQALATAGIAVVIAGVAFTAVRGSAALASILFTVAVLLLPLNGLRRGGVTASDAALVAAVGLSLMHSDLLRRPPRLPRRFVVGVYIFVVAGLFGTVTSTELEGMANFGRLLGTMLAAVVGISLWRPSIEHVRTLAWAWLAGNTVNVLVAVATMRSLDAGRRPQGLTTHPNALGLICAMSVGFAIFLYSGSGLRGRRTAVGLVLLSLLGVAVSGSRAAVLAAAATLVVRAFLGTSPTAKFAATIAAAIVAALAGPLSARLPGSSALSRLLHPSVGGVAASNADRVGKLHDSVAAIQLHPWTGIGFTQANYGHDLALQVAVSAGLVGLAGFIAACVPMVAPVFARDRSDWRWLALPPLGFFVAALFTNNLWDRYVWFALGLGMLAYLNTRPAAPGATAGGAASTMVRADA